MAALRTLQVFIHPRCPHSRALVEDFRRRGISFVEIDISEEEGLQQLKEASWERKLPIILDHERLSIGFKGSFSTFSELGIR